MCAYAEALRRFPGEEILLVSLGTGELVRKIPYEDANDWGLAEWALPILSVLFDGVSDAVDYQLSHVLAANFFRFQCTLNIASDDMDNTSAANITAPKQQADQLLSGASTQLDELVARS